MATIHGKSSQQQAPIALQVPIKDVQDRRISVETHLLLCIILPYEIIMNFDEVLAFRFFKLAGIIMLKSTDIPSLFNYLERVCRIIIHTCTIS